MYMVCFMAIFHKEGFAKKKKNIQFVVVNRALFFNYSFFTSFYLSFLSLSYP